MKKLQLFALTASLSLSGLATAKPISEAPWLRNHLPEKITAYARIPHPMFFFTSAETPLKSLYNDKNYVESVHNIKSKFISDIGKIESLSDDEKTAISALFTHLRAPVEIMVEEFVSLETPPAVLIATKLDYTTAETFVADLKTLLKEHSILIEPEANGKGAITFSDAPIKAQYEYQPKTGRLLITIAEKPTNLSDIINQQARTDNSPIAEKEAQIDDSAQGLFATLKIHPMMLMAIPREYAQLANQLGFMGIKEVSAGLGVANSRPKLKAIIDMPKTGLRQLIPAYPSVTSTKYYGDLSTLFSISLPNTETIEKAAEIFGKSKDLADFSQKYEQESGLSLNDIFTVTGRNITFINDDSGSYAVTDKQFDKDITHLVQTLNAKNIPISLTEEKLHGTTIKHLDLTPSYSYVEAQFKKQNKTASLAAARWIVKNHYYWIIEGDAVIISSLPQPLWARKQLDSSGTIQSTLDKHHIKHSKPFISAVFNVRNLSQSSYYQQLQLLQTLGDAAELPIDINQYPAVHTLSLPRYGAMALNIDNSGQQLSLEYSLENGIPDLLVMWQQPTPMAGVGAVGVLAAIAIPAYQDYIIRAKLTSSMKSVAPLKVAISEAIQEGKTLEEITGENLNTDIELVLKNLSKGQFVEVDEGSIYISVDESGDGMLIFSPEIDDTDHSVSWTCEGYEISHKHLPRACQ